MEDETLVVLSKIEALNIEHLNLDDENDPNASGRCRIYNSSKDKIGCKNVSSESACQEWAQWKDAYAYGWAPGYSC